MTQKIRKRYKQEEDKYVIELRLKSARQLFDERDPAPFREKDLDEDLVEYIVTSAQEITTDKVGKIKIHVEENCDAPTQEMVVHSVHDFFQYEAELMTKKIGYTLRVGVKSLFIGLLFLAAAVFTSFIFRSDESSYFRLFIREGLVLLGWVSMWRPINIFLYEWWPLADLRQLYEKLSKVKIEVMAKDV